MGSIPVKANLPRRGRRALTGQGLVLLTTLYVVFILNGAFFTQVLEVYPLSLEKTGFLLSLVVVMVSLLFLMLSAVSSRWTTKPVLMATLIVSAVTGYFMNSYGTVLHHTMIHNMVETDPAEVADLLTPGLLLYVLLLGVLPAILIHRIRLDRAPWRRELFRRLCSMGASILAIVLVMATFSASYASMFREHKSLCYYANPVYFVYSIGKYATDGIASRRAGPVRPLGTDARILPQDTDRELIILVVGETVRADHMSLNGYGPETNPLLGAEDVISFSNVTSRRYALS